MDALTSRLTRWTKPLVPALPLATLTDLGRSKSELIAENALLRQQLIILQRQVKRPVCTKTDRVLLVFLAKLVRTWNQALLIIQPETLLRWHRELFRLYWKRKSKASSHRPKVTDLFFRPLFAFFLIELRVTEGDPRGRDTLADRCLGGAYRCEKLPRTGKRPSI